jgi:DNA-binding NtrC family response regulator
MSDYTILAIDDDAAILSLLAETLRDEGYNVQTASNGRAALDVIDRVKVDVIISDLAMPVMDGRAFANALRERGQGTPVILMTAGRIVETQLQEIGAAAHLQKPFDVDALLKTIEGLLPNAHHYAAPDLAFRPTNPLAR